MCASQQEALRQRRKYPGTTIVTDSVTSNGLTTFIEQLGGKHFRLLRLVFPCCGNVWYHTALHGCAKL